MPEVDTHNLLKGSSIIVEDARFAEGVEKGEHVISLYLILIRPISSGFML